ncbi:MAG: hypothetical protein ACXWJJ_14505 [Ramlibacter sp.]
MVPVDVEHATAPLQRTVVIGMSGAGKSRLARRLALLQGAQPVELDALYWGPHWTPRPLSAFRRDVVGLAAGHLRRVWLNLSFPRVFWRVLCRTPGQVRAWLRRQEQAGDRVEGHAWTS